MFATIFDNTRTTPGPERTETAFRQRYGITRFANIRGYRPGGIPFEGPPFLYRSREAQFKLWSADPLTEATPDGFGSSAEFRDEMTPHFDYESDAVMVDGNMAQAFARDCA